MNAKAQLCLGLAAGFGLLALSEYFGPSQPSGRWGWLQGSLLQAFGPMGYVLFLAGVSAVFCILSFIVNVKRNTGSEI